MKKILTGFAVGALALGIAVPASAGGSDSIYEIVEDYSAAGTLLVDSAGLDELLDECGNGTPQYTVFFPTIFLDGVWENGAGDAFLDAVDLTLGQLLAQPALIKALLLYHVVPSEVLPDQMDDEENTKFNSLGGLVLLKTTEFDGDININGLELSLDGFDACNGYVYIIDGVLAPNNDLATIGLTNDGSTTQAAAGSGEGLPATGSESLALTYAALASLIAGAGVLVIRRRSVA